MKIMIEFVAQIIHDNKKYKITSSDKMKTITAWLINDTTNL